LNIGFIIFGYPPEVTGGAELQAKKLAKILSKNHKIIIFAGSKSNEILYENVNLKIIKIKYRNISILRLFIAQIISFLPYIKREVRNLHCLICYQVNPSGIVGLFSKFLFKIPLITWLRAESEYKLFLRKYVFTPLILKYSNKVIVQTKKIKMDLLNTYSNNLLFIKDQLKHIEVIPNGIEIKNNKLLSYKDRNGMLFVGRLHKTKGIEYLISAIDGINEKLFLIGDGPEKNKLLQLSKNMNVEFLGELTQEEVLKYMNKTKFLILPSLHEALPNVILEAMSVGLPVISTKVGGIPDILEHGKSGFLVGPGDIENLRKYIIVLLKNEELWLKIHNSCLKEARKYSWENIEQKVEKVLMGSFR